MAYRVLVAMAVEIRPVAPGASWPRSSCRRQPGGFIVTSPTGVAPLLMDLKKRLDRKKNPFFVRLSMPRLQHFPCLSRRPGARSCAHADRAPQRRLPGTQRVGPVFRVALSEGMIPRGAAARALLERPRHGCASGPRPEGWAVRMDFSTNHESGLLIEGHEHPPDHPLPPASPLTTSGSSSRTSAFRRRWTSTCGACT